MSSLWTPSGEHQVEREGGAGAPPAPPAGGPPPRADRADAEAEVEALRQQLAQTPAETVIANHCYGLFELGAIYLSIIPPPLEEARLAIDALGALVDGLGERLGETLGPLRDALAQIRLAYVQVEAATRAAEAAAGSPGD
jgi:hypothetical protein